MGKIKVYVIAKTKKQHHGRNDSICKMLDERFEIYKPHLELPQASEMPHSQLGGVVAEACINAIKSAQIAIAVAPYGNDCNWELGFCADKIPVVLVADEDGHWREDWMAKRGSITAIALLNPALEKVILNDPILRNRPCRYVADGDKLSDFLSEIAQKYPAGVLASRK